MISTWLDFCKAIYHSNQDIEGYVSTGKITANEYKQITGQDYVIPTTTTTIKA